MLRPNNFSADIEIRIKRYHPSYRRRLRQLSGLSPKLADLLASFPAAAIAIVSPELDANRRGMATQLVKRGRALREVAGALDLPYWTRRLPPEALAGPLTDMPSGPECESRLPMIVPDDPAEIYSWLRWVQFACRAVHPGFALWIAEQKVYAPPHWGAGVPLLPLAAFAWYSDCGHGPARDLITRPWNRRMPFRAAAAATRDWLDRIAVRVRRPVKRRGPGRYSAGHRNGFRIVPLRTAAELREEGRVMNHCVATYAGEVARGECTILSIRDGARRVATLEIRPCVGGYRIVQLQGPGNRRVPAEVWQTVREWLAEQPRDPRAMLSMGDEIAIKPEHWVEIWHPYVAATGTTALSPDVACLNQLHMDADALQLLLDRPARW